MQISTAALLLGLIFVLVAPGRSIPAVASDALASCEADVPLRATAQRAETRLKVAGDASETTVEVHCPRGIGRTILTRTADQWPQAICLRMHLKGLESFQATVGATTVQWAVSSTNRQRTHVTLRQDDQETTIDHDSPYFTELQIVADAPRIPLAQGYFEVTLPAKLLQSNPEQIELQWIDFYRN